MVTLADGCRAGRVPARVLMVAHAAWPDSVGGTELYLHALTLALTRMGVDVALHLPSGRGRGETADRSAEAAFSARLRAERPELVHIHHLSGHPATLPELVVREGIPLFITLHDHHYWCSRGQLADRDARPCPGPEPTRCARCVVPGQPLASRPWMRALLARPARAERRATLMMSALKQADEVFAPSRAIAARAPVATTPCPLPLPRPVGVAPVSEPGPLRFLFLGSLIPTKGPQVALEAFARLPAWSGQLDLVGPAPLWQGRPDAVARLRRRAAEVPGVRVLPGVPPEAVCETLAAHDVLLLPSLWEENSPLVALEGRSAGMVALISAIGGLPELMPQAVKLPPGDVNAWADAMAGEVRRGRRRVPSLAPVGLDEHAKWLCGRYAERLAARGGPRGRVGWEKE